MTRILVATLIGLLAVGAASGAPQTKPTKQDPLAGWLAELERAVPRDAPSFSAAAIPEVAKAAAALESWAARVARLDQARQSDQVLTELRRLLEVKSRVDEILDRTVELRVQFSQISAAEARRAAVCAYLRISSQLIDLSGRLRYLQLDGLNLASERLGGSDRNLAALADLGLEHASSMTALVLARWLHPAADDAPNRAPPSSATLRKILRLVAKSGQASLLPDLVGFLDSPGISPDLVLDGAETIRQLGLPQVPRPDPAEELPPPPITAGSLLERLEQLDASKLEADLATRHAELLAWLRLRRDQGVTEDHFRLGSFDVRPGDWLLMRNPSPYNLFTDLSPGLFTHVGIVCAEIGADAQRRFVLVDLPERGQRVPATNVETYVLRTLNYVFLRDPDETAARQLSQAALSTIGNASQFDLNFRTQRVLDLAHQDLAGKMIHTYCAGFLLLCALQTDVDRHEYFPIPEFPAGGRTVENLAQLGLTFGEDFISPTGAMFSRRLHLVGRREPMYDPRREVEEAVFDHFANCLVDRVLVPAPNLAQALRLKLAEAAEHNPLLAQALAQAAGVNADMDLVAGAKAAAVVETLDEVAFGASADFMEARDWLQSGPLEEYQGDLTPDELSSARKFLKRHAQLYQKLLANQLSPRQLRQELVKYYLQSGRAEIERRFFSQAAPK